MPGPVLEAHEIRFKFFYKEGSSGFHQVVQKEGVWGMSGTKPDPRANVSMLKAAGGSPHLSEPVSSVLWARSGDQLTRWSPHWPAIHKKAGPWGEGWRGPHAHPRGQCAI